MSDISKVDEFLTNAKVFYLATVDGDQPKCRPLGFHLLDDGKIYFGVGTFKNVYKQLEANPKLEIVAFDGERFLRYFGVAVLEDNEDVVNKAFDLMPEIAEIYKSNGWQMGIFYVDDATAEFRNMFEAEETFTFKY